MINRSDGGFKCFLWIFFQLKANRVKKEHFIESVETIEKLVC